MTGTSPSRVLPGDFSRPPLFYLDPLPTVGQLAVLSLEESRHAGAARRLQSGDRIGLMDGRGGLAEGRIENLPRKNKDSLTVRAASLTQAPPASPQIELACALPKGDRLAVLLDMATQLGMTAFTPLVCRRGVVEPGAVAPPRWRKIMLEACKQSRRLWLPAINSPAVPADVAAQAAKDGSTLLIAHPETKLPEEGPDPPVHFMHPTANSFVNHRQDACATWVLFIGPEGGFTDEEVSAVVGQSGQIVSLGQAILRIETAAVALLARITCP